MRSIGIFKLFNEDVIFLIIGTVVGYFIIISSLIVNTATATGPAGTTVHRLEIITSGLGSVLFLAVAIVVLKCYVNNVILIATGNNNFVTLPSS